MSITNETKIVEEKFDDCVPAESAQLFDSELHHILTFERAQETKEDVSRYEDEDTNNKSKEQASL